MALAIIMFVALMGVATMLVLGRTEGMFAHGHLSRLPENPTSPLDEAERILARRYVRGEISADEYDRMQAILRR